MTNPSKVGLLFGALISGWHVLWSLLVLVGLAQPLIDFVFWAHMIQPVYVIKPFDPIAAVSLIAITFSTGYVLGFIGAVVWTKLHQPPNEKTELQNIFVPIDPSPMPIADD